ncbi:putative signal peptide protein [Puccinia sorghi]|uniref:Putative signal peptide protein n=1 Tax=Puccinia sorghi TaxID=27349 RepID=A0A0L6VK81_9BASI|nr:putative signal peptide protein [Puccinia sorghi]
MTTVISLELLCWLNWLGSPGGRVWPVSLRFRPGTGPSGKKCCSLKLLVDSNNQTYNLSFWNNSFFSETCNFDKASTLSKQYTHERNKSSSLSLDKKKRNQTYTDQSFIKESLNQVNHLSQSKKLLAFGRYKLGLTKPSQKMIFQCCTAQLQLFEHKKELKLGWSKTKPMVRLGQTILLETMPNIHLHEVSLTYPCFVRALSTSLSLPYPYLHPNVSQHFTNLEGIMAIISFITRRDTQFVKILFYDLFFLIARSVEKGYQTKVVLRKLQQEQIAPLILVSSTHDNSFPVTRPNSIYFLGFPFPTIPLLLLSCHYAFVFFPYCAVLVHAW